MITTGNGWKLVEKQVDVWLADLDWLKGRLDSFMAVLSQEEREKAGRFHFEKDGEHYAVAHGVLRLLLSAYLKIAPREVQFCFNNYSKPALDCPGKPIALEFNLSHSHGLALYGFTVGRSIGVDVEQIRNEMAVEELAHRFFAPTEVTALMTFPKEMRVKAFFNGWCRKEAFIKARGMGFSLPLDHFAVSISDGSPALLSLNGDPEAPQRWQIREIKTRESFVAAVAVDGPIKELNYRDFL